MSAFTRTFETEMRGYAIESWMEFLAWIHSEGFSFGSREQYRAEAERRVANDELPPWPDFSRD